MLGATLIAAAPACSSQRPEPLASASTAARFDSRPTNVTCVAGPLALGRIALKPVYEGFTSPFGMEDRSADRGLVYVGEVGGRIKVVDVATGTTTVALDVTAEISKTHEGLVGFAVHPSKPYLYLTVDRDLPAPIDGNNNRGEIIRFTSNDGGRTYDPASETLLLRMDRPGQLHPPGTMLFGPEGYLYIGIGEVGIPYSTNRLYGSILRLDVDGGTPYAIPPDNPFATGGGRPEVWAGGFRNPWRFSFDRLTGDLWEGDVGENTYEEINRVEKGKNYGWRTVEGDTCLDGTTTCDRTGLTPPVFVYPHTEGRSVTGGYVYRGTAMPDLVGRYVFADFVTGQIRMLDGEGSNVRSVLLNTGGTKPLIPSFAEDPRGELYAVGYDTGVVYKLLPGDTTSDASLFPPLLSQTGCVDAAHPENPAPGLVPYGVNVELWSDGLDKRRWVAIPDGTTIKVDDATGDFELPPGSIAMKEFSLGGKRIETRLLRRHLGGEWTATTYEWNEDGTDAVLSEHAKNKVLANGQTWQLPSQVQCFGCHTGVAGTSLGLEALQLNGDHRYGPTQSENQLGKLSAIGYLDHAVEPTKMPHLAPLASQASLEERARSYLHANCSFCHRENGPTGTLMDLRYGLPLAAVRSCSPSYGLAVADAQIAKPGDPEHSAIPLRMALRTGPMMPPAGSNLPDTHAIDVITSWIRGRTTCE
ncbi:MAG: hypothetical protein JWP97_2066 [Labilithrix sp.]|nr:hypothetical protein [Labilithrix sp.]